MFLLHRNAFIAHLQQILVLQWFKEGLSIEQKEPQAVITWVRVEKLLQLRAVIINGGGLILALLSQYIKEEESNFTHVNHGVFDDSAYILPPFCHVRVVLIQIRGKG